MEDVISYKDSLLAYAYDSCGIGCIDSAAKTLHTMKKAADEESLLGGIDHDTVGKLMSQFNSSMSAVASNRTSVPIRMSLDEESYPDSRLDSYDKLEETFLASMSQIKSKIAILHTRKASHGPVADCNAHPHHDLKNRIALFHNGLIANYDDIAAALKS